MLRSLQNFSDDHWLHHPMNVKQSNFNSYIYALFLDHFYAQIVVVRWNLCKLHSSDMLLTNVFSHDVKQPSPWLTSNRTLRCPIEMLVYPWRRLMTRSHDQLTFISVWSQLVWNGSYKESQRQVYILKYHAPDNRQHVLHKVKNQSCLVGSKSL